MSLFAKITALLLLTLWVPATLHCDLEAAGLLQDVEQSESCCQTAHEQCAEETCGDFTRSNANFTLSPVQYAAPLWLNNFNVLLARFELIANATAWAQFSQGDTPAIQSLARTWSFVRRSALPVRAPALVA